MSLCSWHEVADEFILHREEHAHRRTDARTVERMLCESMDFLRFENGILLSSINFRDIGCTRIVDNAFAARAECSGQLVGCSCLVVNKGTFSRDVRDWILAIFYRDDC